MGILKKLNFLFHPVGLFVSTILALIFTFGFSLYWNWKNSSQIQVFLERFNQQSSVFQKQWPLIVVLSVLGALILFGVSLIFFYYQKSNRLNRIQQDFINNFTHELKTPLASIKLHLETMKEYDLEREEFLHFLSLMLKDTQRLSRHVTQILQAGKLDSQARKVNREKIPVLNYINEFWQQNAHTFEGLQIDLKNTGSDYILYADKVLFDVLLSNIFSNAQKYKKEEQEKVTLKISSYEDKGRWKIDFQDNGIGIEKGQMKKIFKKFYRIQTKRNLKGTGLGLFICRQIAKLHGARFTVNSMGYGLGSTFTLSMASMNWKKR